MKSFTTVCAVALCLALGACKEEADTAEPAAPPATEQPAAPAEPSTAAPSNPVPVEPGTNQ